MKNVFLLLLMIGLFNCEPSSKKPTGITTQELLKSREIKKILEVDILEAAMKKGSELSVLAQKTLSSKLKSALQSKGIAHAVEFCNISAIPTMDSLTKAYGATVKRVSMKLRNSQNAPNNIEAQILEAYSYNIEKNISIDEAVQILDEHQSVLYTKPIMINNPMCIKCHGIVGSQISESNYGIIKGLYPNDSAINYNMNDLRGMWSISFSKKDIIQAMD